jgi:prophage DNA circulation protein
VSWIDQLERVKHPDGRELIGASFRGVPFFVEDSSRSGGRRKASKEFIDQDIPRVTDLGKKGNDFRLEGYVLGADYMLQRDALWDALQEVAGPGSLVHPFYGRNIRVQAGDVSVNETRSNGGIAKFSIEFAHAPQESSTRVSIDLDAAVEDFAAAALIANSSELEGALIVVGQPAFALASLSADLTNVTAQLKEELAGVTVVTQELAKMTQTLDIMAAQATALVRTPVDMLTTLAGVTVSFAETIKTRPLEVVNALLAAYSVERVAAATGLTEARTQERANQTVFALAIRLVLLSEACRIVTGVAFKSTSEAIATRDNIVDALDVLAETAGTQAYPALVSMRSAVLRAVPGDSTLARIVTIQQFEDLPALVIAYQVHGTASKEADVIARNSAQHPGFMSGSIEVLIDA